MVGYIQVSIHFKLLKPNEKLNLERCCQKLDYFKTILQEKMPVRIKWKNLILIHDNVRQHATLGTSQKLAEQDWGTLSHPPYSPDLAPPCHHFFMSSEC
ncbi:hypothetical protein TNCV_233241 [Trichonephila clavipes]|nr:hypothetical protein TNCV_233241 [Trichonephila clavipes]